MNNTCREEYFGCSCSGLNHVVQLMHFPPDPKYPDPDYDNTISITGTFQQWRDAWKPAWMYSITDIFTKKYWNSFWHGTVYSKIPVAFKYIFNGEIFGYSVLDTMNFQERDFNRLYFFLDQISDGHDAVDNIDEVIWLESHNERWELRIEINNMFPEDNEYLPELGIDVQFKSRKFFGRVLHGTKYIFNCNGGNEIGFLINEEDSKKLKGMIIHLQQIEKQIEERKKDERTKSNTE
jgi:hypothetical protein